MRFFLTGSWKYKKTLFPDRAKIFTFKLDNDLLDQIYEQAKHKAIAIYQDAKFSRFSIQILPFDETGLKLNLYFSFYSKWANKICRFGYHGTSQTVIHHTPNRPPRFEIDSKILTNLPWKESPHWREILERIYTKVGPFAPTKLTSINMRARKRCFSPFLLCFSHE